MDSSALAVARCGSRWLVSRRMLYSLLYKSWVSDRPTFDRSQEIINESLHASNKPPRHPQRQTNARTRSSRHRRGAARYLPRTTRLPRGWLMTLGSVAPKKVRRDGISYRRALGGTSRRGRGLRLQGRVFSRRLRARGALLTRCCWVILALCRGTILTVCGKLGLLFRIGVITCCILIIVLVVALSCTKCNL